MPIKAVFIDLDGTLLNPQHQVSDYTADVLKQIKDKGIYFVVATGRPYAEVFHNIRQCGLTPDFIITSNGARIHDGAYKVVREHNMKPALVEAIASIRAVKDPATGADMPKQFTTNIYREADWLTDKVVPAMVAAFHKDFTCTDIGAALYDLKAADLHGVHEMFFLGPHEKLLPVDKELKEKFGADLCLTFSLPEILDCVPAGVAKGNGVREVAEVLGITLDDVACFGDGMNDESMLSLTRAAYIMSNGQQRLKDAVPHAEIIGSNAEDGVAKKLAALFLSS